MGLLLLISSWVLISVSSPGLSFEFYVHKTTVARYHYLYILGVFQIQHTSTLRGRNQSFCFEPVCLTVFWYRQLVLIINPVVQVRNLGFILHHFISLLISNSCQVLQSETPQQFLTSPRHFSHCHCPCSLPALCRGLPQSHVTSSLTSFPIHEPYLVVMNYGAWHCSRYFTCIQPSQI